MASSIVIVIALLLSQSLVTITRQNVEAEELELTASYRDDVKNLFRRRNPGANVDESMCKARLTPALSQSHLAELFSATDKDYELGILNPIPEKSFTEFTLTRTFMRNVQLVSEGTAYQVESPGIFEPMFLPMAKIRVVQADMMFELQFKKQKEITKPLRMKLAIRRLDDTYSLIECGQGQLASSISHIEFCKTMGADFEFVYDNFDGPGTGQCYAPIYDPCYTAKTPTERTACEESHSAYSGTKDHKVTHLAPLKTVFCQMLIQGKSYTFPFCTGVK